MFTVLSCSPMDRATRVGGNRRRGGGGGGVLELYVCVLARAVCRGAFIIYRDKAKRSEQSRAPKTGREEDKNEMIKKKPARG